MRESLLGRLNFVVLALSLGNLKHCKLMREVKRYTRSTNVTIPRPVTPSSSPPAVSLAPIRGPSAVGTVVSTPPHITMATDASEVGNLAITLFASHDIARLPLYISFSPAGPGMVQETGEMPLLRAESPRTSASASASVTPQKRSG
ncbi:hypothetical protein E2C01_006065 [Portunus trituberculatus]|uniref:Reverse transcriptase/retrotransposon-derived protein RNase H-like domain-containing protein n=1 Tax=Portunus trituberculatus TaxID=210409 RepID=A0A5B7D0S6_PORTR|nr:hypothetical protein [Portunus trituberculatus]